MMPTAAASSRLISSLTVGGWIGVALAVASALLFVRALMRLDGTAKREAVTTGWLIVLMSSVAWLMTRFG